LTFAADLHQAASFSSSAELHRSHMRSCLALQPYVQCAPIDKGIGKKVALVDILKVQSIKPLLMGFSNDSGASLSETPMFQQ